MIRFEDRLAGADNFQSWKIRIIMLLKENKVETFIKPDKVKPEAEPDLSNWNEGNDKAMKIIIDGVRDHIVPILSKYDKAYEMYKALEKTYEINNASKKLALKREMNQISMNKNEKINAYFLRVSALRDQLSLLGHEIDGKELALIALDGLPESWETFVAGISARSKFPKFDRLRTDCLQEESRLDKRGLKKKINDEENHALNVNTHKKKKFKHFRKKKFNTEYPKRDLSHVKCFRCDKPGHVVTNCPYKNHQASFTKSKKKPNEEIKKEQFVLYSALSNQVPNKNIWVIDSGSSRHITGFKELLETMTEESDEEVTIGDDSSYPVRGIGTCTIKLKTGISIQLTGVLFVPGIKRNLLSISALEDNGYRVTFMDGKVKAWPKGLTFKQANTIGRRQGCLYELNTDINQVLVNDISNLNEVWHRRLGHLNYKTLSSMENLVNGLPKLKQYHSGACKGCALGKNTKGTFQNSVSRTNEVLELIHSDLCGPMSVSSIGGCKYYIIFVDDFSRKTWIYFLKYKESEEVLSKFKDFKSITENLSGKKIKILRTDNGKEYTSEIFKQFCKEAGIKREYTVPYNPQQNGVAERKNRTIIEATKAMLLDQNLDTSLWAEASNTAVYIQNRCPHSHIENKTPEEAFTGTKPDISNL